MPDSPDILEMLGHLLAEQRLVQDQLAKLTSELRAKKRKTQRRLKTIAQANSEKPIDGGPPTALERAAARRILAK